MRVLRILLLLMLSTVVLSGCSLNGIDPDPPAGMSGVDAVKAHAALSNAVNNLATDLARRVPRGTLKRIAVLDPAGPSKDLTEFSSYLTDKLIKRFVELGTFGRVLERRRLHEVLAQQQFELSAHFDPKTVAPLGRKLGVDGLVVGRVRSLGRSLLEISLKLIKAETGEVLAASEQSLKVNGLVTDMLRRPLTAEVRVVVEPVGAGGTVSVDSQRHALTQAGAVFTGVPQGSRVVSVSASGYAAQSKTVYITGDRTYSFRLKVLRGRLNLAVRPAGALVKVDGSRVSLGSGGTVSLRVGQGRHTVTAEATGYQSATRVVQVDEAGAAVEIALVKGAAGHWLWLTVDPPGAKVNVDGQPLSLDAAGKAGLRLSPGLHRLVLSAAGHRTVYKSVTLGADREMILSLPPAPMAPPPAPVVSSGPMVSPPPALRLKFSAVYQDRTGRIRPLKPGAVLDSGANYALSFQPSADCWAYVFQVDSSGRFFRLFPDPNRAPGINPLRAGRRYWVPSPDSWLYLDQVKGREKIFVVVTRRPNRELQNLYRRLHRTSDPQLRAKVERRLMQQLGVRPSAGVTPYGTRRVSYGGSVFKVTEQVLLSSGAEMVYSIEFQHR